MNYPNPPQRINELDALRGIAALAVVFFHFTMGKPQGNSLFAVGSTGVDLFFVISGFVIFMSLQHISSSKEFIVSRVSRLYPTYWASVSFSFLINVVYALVYHKKVDFLQYVGNMTMFQYYLRIPNLDGPYWTMIIEMLFYIAILFLFHFGLLAHIKKIGLISTIGIVCFALFFPAKIVHFVFVAIPLLPYLPLFYSGIIFYKLYMSPTKNGLLYSQVAFCLICQVLLFEHAGVARAYISHELYTLMIVLYFGIFLLLVNKKLSFVVNPWTLFFGRISFALYLIHQKFSVSILIPYLTEKLHINFWVAAFGISLPIVIFFATCITYFVEIPFGKKLKSALKARFLKSKLVV